MTDDFIQFKSDFKLLSQEFQESLSNLTIELSNLSSIINMKNSKIDSSFKNFEKTLKQLNETNFVLIHDQESKITNLKEEFDGFQETISNRFSEFLEDFVKFKDDVIFPQ